MGEETIGIERATSVEKKGEGGVEAENQALTAVNSEAG